MNMKIIVGGTFDQLHDGHKALLNKAIELATLYKGKLIITISDGLLPMTKSHRVSKYDDRVRQVIQYINSKKYIGHYQIFPLCNIFPDDVKIYKELDTTESATIIVSEETYIGALEIRRIFKELHMCNLTIVVIPMIMASDGDKISSTRVREGKINLQGKVL
jgi:pantetheine-phosphate adenylyltransferase